MAGDSSRLVLGIRASAAHGCGAVSAQDEVEDEEDRPCGRSSAHDAGEDALALPEHVPALAHSALDSLRYTAIGAWNRFYRGGRSLVGNRSDSRRTDVLPVVGIQEAVRCSFVRGQRDPSPFG